MPRALARFMWILSNGGLYYIRCPMEVDNMEVDKTTSEDPPSNHSEPEIEAVSLLADVEEQNPPPPSKPEPPPTTEVETPPTTEVETPPTTEVETPPATEVETSKLTNGLGLKKQIDYSGMSAGVYLDSTVVPILQVALVTLNRLRPADPVQFLIDYLLRHKAQYSKSKEQPVMSNPSSTNQAP